LNALDEPKSDRGIDEPSARSTASNDTARRLAEAGYKWHSDVLNSDLPYIRGPFLPSGARRKGAIVRDAVIAGLVNKQVK
jgi:hypothetical protein